MRFSILFLTLTTNLAAAAYTTYSQCTDHHTYANATPVAGPVDMGGSPLTHFDAPMIRSYNDTAVEDWSFDGVSTEGSAGIGITFSRGTTAGVHLAQRVLIAFVWPNGTRYMETSYSDTSTIQQCKHSIVGIWKNSTSGASWRFETSPDYKHTVVLIESPTVRGTFVLRALVPAVYPNGLEYPSPEGLTLFAPQLWWVENVPVAEVSTNFLVKGTELHWEGVGGREHNWNSNAWGDISADWDMGRAKVGPYCIIVWRYTSGVDRQTSFRMILFKGQKVIFRTSKNGADETFQGNYGFVKRTNSGPVRLESDRNTPNAIPASSFSGYELEFVAPDTKEHWKFSVEFTKGVFWFQASETISYGAYVAKVVGGKVGARQYEGLASGNVFEEH